MSFPRYPEYKESGVEWLGQVPEGWSVTNLKRGFQVTLGKMLQPEKKSDDELLLPYLRAANVSWVGVDVSDIKKMWISDKEREHLILSSGDLLVSEGGDVGRSCLWESELSECYFQNSLNRVRPKEGNSTKFLYYWMVTIKNKGFVDVLCNKSTIAHFTAEKLQEIAVPFPPADEQVTVARFLDHETAKIDALIAEQEKLIELLKEKRQAVISHAVTKGLEPNVKMKDSGVEWLGQMPEHWGLARLGKITSAINDINHEMPESVPEGIPFLSAKDLDEYGNLNFAEDVKLISEQDFARLSQKICPEVGDIIYSRYGSIGRAAVVRTDRKFLVSYSCCVIKIKRNDIVLDFLRDVLSSDLILTESKARIRSMGQPDLGLAEIRKFPIPLPPISEQILIDRYLKKEIKKIDDLFGEADRAISLFRERRSALISAAVTGQIDVRNFVPEAEPA